MLLLNCHFSLFIPKYEARSSSLSLLHCYDLVSRGRVRVEAGGRGECFKGSYHPGQCQEGSAKRYNVVHALVTGHACSEFLTSFIAQQRTDSGEEPHQQGK
jgi:hypothetical protein